MAVPVRGPQGPELFPVAAAYMLGRMGQTPVLAQSQSCRSPASGENAGRRGARYFWNTNEVRLLKEHYPAHDGLDRVVELLPGRSRTSIEQKARAIGLEAEPGQATKARRYESSPLIDAQIEAAYKGEMSPGTVERLARRLMRPQWWVSRRASQLGLGRSMLKQADWSVAELRIIEGHADSGLGVVHQKLVDAGFVRSLGAVATKLKRMSISRVEVDAWSAHALSRLMGVDEKTVVRWVTREGLPAHRDGSSWKIRAKELRRWIATHAVQVNMCRVSKEWFIDLLVNG